MSCERKVTDCLERAVANHEMAGISVLVRRGGKDVFYAQAGYADLESGRWVARDDLFRLYSQSKPVTAAAAMILMERGLIDLSDPVEKFLPGFAHPQVLTADGPRPAQRSVLLMDLLGMTAGLCYPDADPAGQYAAQLFGENQALIDQGGGMSTVEFANRMGQLPLSFQPGSAFRYSTCADVMGAVIEVASGKPFEDFLQAEIFEPLGMKDTAFWVPPEKQSRFATCYRRVNGALEPFRQSHLCVGVYDRKPAFASGGAGLVSTLDDYAAFADMLMNGGEYKGRRILSPATVRFMTQPQMGPGPRATLWESLDGYDYGKFMRICTEPGRVVGLASPGEYGWDGWLGSYFCNMPAEGLTILSMQNTTDTGTCAAVRKVRNLVLAAASAGEL